MYPVQIEPDRYIDCDPPGAFLNHSCSANAAISGGIRLIAIQPIAVGEEITMDYSCSMSGDPDGGMICLCGSANCRGRITNFEDLPANLKSELLNRKLVADFISAKYALI